MQKDHPKAICNVTAPKTLPQHIPRKLQLNCQSAYSRSTALPQHIPRKLQLLSGYSSPCIIFFASAHPAQIATKLVISFSICTCAFASAHPAQIATAKNTNVFSFDRAVSR
jgi:hypothetical protein